MAKKFLSSFAIVSLPSDPPTGINGEVYFNTTTNIVRIWHGNQWNDLSAAAGGGSNSFSIISTPSGSNPVADSSADTLNLSASNGISITGNSTTDTVEFSTNATSLNTASTIVSRDANQSFDITGIDFDTTDTIAAAVGRLSWDDGEGTLTLGLKGGNVNLQIGQENVALCYNGTGSTITNGSVVYISGAQGQRPSISLADADAESTSSKTFGIATENISSGAEGFVATFGIVSGLNTSGFTAGQALWLSSTAGQLTNIKPSAPAHAVFVGYCLHVNASSGRIFVNPQNGYEIEELHNVSISSLADNHILSYDNATSLWKNQGLAAAIQEVDGASSGIDADLLDGQHGSYYAPINSPTFTETVNLPTTIISGNTSTDLVRITQTGSGNALVVEDDTNPDSTPLIVNSSGNVGVGFSSPIGKFHTKGQTYFTSGSDTTSIRINQTSGISYIQASNATGDAEGTLHLGNWFSNGRLVIIPGGNVGIGNTNPAYKLDVTGDARISTNLVVSGDFTVSGTTTFIDTANLQVEDKNIELGKVTTPTDTTADGGGITLLGTTNKTFNWVDSTDSWTSSENIDLASGKVIKINGIEVLSATQFTGNAATVTNGVYTTGSYSDPSWLTISKSKVGLGNVENTALSTWSGSANITSLGTITSGTWQGSEISTTYTAAKVTSVNGSTGAITGLAVDNTVVHTSGNETVGGIKTFTSPVVVDAENAEGTITLGDISTGTGSTDAGVVFDNEANTIKSAIFTEVNGEILSYGINVGQIATRDETRTGGIFRLDTRNSNKEFRVIGQPAGTVFNQSPSEFSRLTSKLDTGLSGVNTGAPAYMWDVSGTTRTYGLNVSSMLTPTAPTAIVTATGGTIAAGTYYFKIVGVDNFGNTTEAGAESLAVTTTGSTSVIRLTWTQVLGAETYRIYYGTTSNDQNAYYTSPNPVIILTALAGTAGTPPTTNTTGNVGIRTTSAPTSVLTIATDTNTLLSNGVNSLRSNGTINLTFPSGGTQGLNEIGPSIAFGRINSGRRGALIASVQTSSDADQTGLLFAVRQDSNTASDLLVEALRIDHLGNVGIGTSSPQYKLEVNGSFAATTKSFVIDHPTKANMKLRYGSLEGPENGVYVRGKSKSSVITLPDYWIGLIDENSITVQLTPIGKHRKLYVEKISNNKVKIGGAKGKFEFFYFIQAERKDVDKLVVEY